MILPPASAYDAENSLSGVRRHDYFPFGEEIQPDASYRTAGRGYGGGNNVRQEFTGYERDNETNLDFAQARYYASQMGRFASTDPLMASGRPANPQTWNRYAYALNNPLRVVDPTGMSDADPQPQATPPPQPPIAPPPVDSSLEGSPEYVAQQALAPRPNVDITIPQPTAVMDEGPLPNGFTPRASCPS